MSDENRNRVMAHLLTIARIPSNKNLPSRPNIQGTCKDARKLIEFYESELARLRAELSTQETLVATLQEQKYAWDELKSDNARLRKAIEDAPHDCTCDIEFETTEHNGCTCGMDTWKRNALKEGK